MKQAPPNRPDQRPAVLIVNDDPHSLLALTAALDDGPWRIVTTDSGVGAFKRLLIEDYAVIVLDVRMPGLDGFAVAEMIRARPRTATTPIIFCSASARTLDDQFKGYELGAVDYLLAPVPPRALRSKVAVFVELHEQKRKLAQTIADLEQAHATLEMQKRELQAAVTRDALTGCLNRAGFTLATAPLLEAAAADEEFAIAAVDIDQPAAIVETHGRAAGDACVRRVAWLVARELRDPDRSCRWRDEQFIMAMPRTALDEAARIAERLCEKIRLEAGAGLAGTAPLRVTASIGVTSTALGAATLGALIAQADAAAGAAHRSGGDCVRLGEPLHGDAAG